MPPSLLPPLGDLESTSETPTTTPAPFQVRPSLSLCTDKGGDPLRLVDHPQGLPPLEAKRMSYHPPERHVLRQIGLDNTSPSSPAGFLCYERLGPRAGNIHGPNITWRHCWRGGGDDPRDLTSGLQLSCLGCCQGILCPLALTLPLKSYRSPLPARL